ncbi:ATP-binding protein [Quadrisphaera sp. INWT6]|nr:ATP-binding protein [Quadrisphaera sp. INWT6]
MQLPVDDRAPSRARHFLSSSTCPAHSHGETEVAQLLVTELVTNALRHGSPPITTEVSCQAPAGLRVRVSDAAAGAPMVRHVDADAESGRGMLLIDQLAAEWGVEPGPAGKAVWFRVNNDPEVTLRPSHR